MFKHKTKSIELFGKKLFLYPRTIKDIHAWWDYNVAHTDKTSLPFLIGTSIIVIEDSLKHNYIYDLPWYKFIERYKRYRLKSVLSMSNLSTTLTMPQMLELSNIVLELDGIVATDSKKKQTQKTQ